jgi:hypothetical protein
MSVKLILGLSLFGLAMGLAKVPPQIEPQVWLGIFVVSAYVIAKRAPGKYFLHGFAVSLLDSLWLTAAHVLFRPSIHGRIVGSAIHLGSPQLAVALGGLLAGIAAGLVLGLLAWISSKFIVSAHSEFAGW